jgi:hypothetical protein
VVSAGILGGEHSRRPTVSGFDDFRRRLRDVDERKRSLPVVAVRTEQEADRRDVEDEGKNRAG